MKSKKRPLPPELSRLLDGADPGAAEDAWPKFLEKFSRRIIRTARSVTSDYDSAMDAYGFILEELRAEDYQRLRAFRAEGAGQFTTWLVIVARRLALDHHRKRYGRVRGPSKNPSPELETRRRLVDLVAGELDLTKVPNPVAANPEHELRRREMTSALETALRELPPADRLLLSRRFEDELPVREVAQLMGLPTVYHVYRQINTLFRDLRERLESVGIDGPEP